MPKPNKHKQPSILKQHLNKKRSVKDKAGNFKISFSYLDTSQTYSSTFKDWESLGLLSKMMDCLKGYCNSPLLEQKSSKFTIYGNFPPSDRTKFNHPNHVPEDAQWARIHIDGVSIIAGHIVNDTFYIVFLDLEHNFYLTRRTREN